MAIKKRHEILAFYGIKYESSGQISISYKRMTKFTQLTQNKNPIEYSRQYVDEAYQFADVVGYAPSIDYAFDAHSSNEVQEDIIKITNDEALGDDAVRTIIIVDITTGEAISREYSVVPSTEGDNANIYTYSGAFKTHEHTKHGVATTTDGWNTISFTISTQGA